MLRTSKFKHFISVSENNESVYGPNQTLLGIISQYNVCCDMRVNTSEQQQFNTCFITSFKSKKNNPC